MRVRGSSGYAATYAMCRVRAYAEVLHQRVDCSMDQTANITLLLKGASKVYIFIRLRNTQLHVARTHTVLTMAKKKKLVKLAESRPKTR